MIDLLSQAQTIPARMGIGAAHPHRLAHTIAGGAALPSATR